jgi:hypothetical protein
MPSEDGDEVCVVAAGGDGKSLWVIIENDVDLPELFRKAYHTDMVCNKILAHSEAHPRFRVVDGLIWTKNQMNRDVVCIPREVFLRGRRIIETIIDHAHKAIGHFSQFKTSLYVRRYYWWPNMAKDITVSCNLCDACQALKTSNKRPRGLLHTLPIPMRPWESVGIDFMGPLPMSQDCDYLMVVIDRLMSSVHLIPTNTTVTATQVTWLYLREVIRLHGVPASIMSDRDSKFTSVF